MTILRISENAPYFVGLSTDIVGNTFTGAKSFLGTKFYTMDTKVWYRILPDGTLSETNDLSGPQGTVSLTIASGAAISNAFNMTTYVAGMVITPGTWTAANIGFKVCDTVDGTYVIAKDKDGVPIQIGTVATGAADAYAIPFEIFSAAYVKVWSKNATAATETDINQAGERVLKVMLK